MKILIDVNLTPEWKPILDKMGMNQFTGLRLVTFGLLMKKSWNMPNKATSSFLHMIWILEQCCFKQMQKAPV